MQREGTNIQQKIARFLKLINQSYSYISPTTYTSNMIPDPIFPALKNISANGANIIFGRQFFIPFKISDRKCFIQRITNDEILRKFSISVSNNNSVISAQAGILNDLLPFRISWTFWYNIMEDDN